MTLCNTVLCDTVCQCVTGDSKALYGSESTGDFSPQKITAGRVTDLKIRDVMSSLQNSGDALWHYVTLCYNVLQCMTGDSKAIYGSESTGVSSPQKITAGQVMDMILILNCRCHL